MYVMLHEVADGGSVSPQSSVCVEKEERSKRSMLMLLIIPYRVSHSFRLGGMLYTGLLRASLLHYSLLYITNRFVVEENEKGC